MSYFEYILDLRMTLTPQNLSLKNVEEDIAWETLCRRGGS